MTAYGLYISHTWHCNGQYDNLVRLLDRASPRVEFKYHSIPKDDPELADKSATSFRIRDLMCDSCLLLLFAGACPTHGRLVEDEVYAASHVYGDSLPVLAIEPYRHECRSKEVKKHGEHFVKMNTRDMVRAIEKYAYNNYLNFGYHPG